jgi:hypothetical protein
MASPVPVLLTLRTLSDVADVMCVGSVVVFWASVPPSTTSPSVPAAAGAAPTTDPATATPTPAAAAPPRRRSWRRLNGVSG